MSRRILFITKPYSRKDIYRHLPKKSGFIPTVIFPATILKIGVQRYIELITQGKLKFDGIVATSDLSSIIGGIISSETGLIFSDLKSLILCQNKYHCRRIQEKETPQIVPKYSLASDPVSLYNLNFPAFVKPLRGHLSMFSYKVNSPSEAREKYLIHKKDLAKLNQDYQKLLLPKLSHNQPKIYEIKVDDMICEDYLEGDQLTVDLSVFRGQIIILGTTQSVYHPEYASFTRFEHPNTHSRKVEQMIKTPLYKLISKLKLNNTLLNIELKYDKHQEKIYIIEINTRMSFQFVNLIKAVSGINLIKIASEIATNQRPSFRKIHTQNSLCYSMVLRKQGNMLVTKTPSPENIRQIYARFPEIKITILVKKNQRLSEIDQDTQSYRYCLIDIPGNSKHEILSKFNKIDSMLDFNFKHVQQKTPLNKHLLQKVRV
jgi:hypothetical protein